MSSFLPMDFTGIQLERIQYKIGAYSLFQELNAHFPLGEITALVGANGSGKSTLLRLIAGMATPTQGRVLYQGQPIQSKQNYRRQLGYVPAVPALYPHLTVLENFRFCAGLKNVNPRSLSRSIQTALALCQLLPYQKVLFGTLSEGLKKRAILASQLIHQPAVLLLDEPCAELDPLQRQQLWQLLAQLRTPERLILLSSHHPQEISTLCPSMYFLHQGSLSTITGEQLFSQVLWDRSAASSPTAAIIGDELS